MVVLLKILSPKSILIWHRTPHTAHRTPLTLLFALFSPLWAFAQLIQEKSPAEVSLTTNEQQFVQRIAQLEDTETTKYISIGDVAQFETNGLLNFSLPGVSGTLQSEAVRVEYTSSSNYIWSAKLTNQPGYFSLIVRPEGKVGFFQLQGRYFDIHPLNSTVSLLREIDLNQLSGEDCALLGTSSAPAIDWCQPDNNNCFAEIDVLVLVTPDVGGWFSAQPDIWQALITAVQGIESVNMAFANSAIPNKQIRWQAEMFNFQGFDPILDIVDDLDDLEVDAAGLREQRQADVVIMLTSMDYIGFAGVASGPDPACPTPSEPCAFAIVEIQSIAGPRWTFAHEFAHLLGARHNRPTNCSAAGVCGNDTTTVCAHAWLFNDAGGNEQRTILARMDSVEQVNGSVRIPHYSNPDVAFNGAPTGTVDNDNSRIIRNAACFVDDFNHAEWIVGIEGPDQWCPEIEPTMTFDAVVTPPVQGWGLPGNPPYQYEWRRNCGPIFNPGNFISNQPSITLSAPYCQPTFWIQLKVTSSEGAVRVVQRKIYPCDWYNGGGEERNTIPVRHGKIASLFPNPADDVFRIVVPNSAEQKTTVRITDGFGKSVKNFTISDSPEIVVSTSDFASGVYFVSVVNGTEIETHKLFINKQ